MSGEVLNLILNAEQEYHSAIKKAIGEAKRYVDVNKDKQKSFVEHLNYEWYLFEKSENESFEKKLLETEKEMIEEIAKRKEPLKASQQKKADLISERLKREVLSIYGDS